MKTAHFLKTVTSILGLSVFLMIYPIGSHAGVVDIHFVELGAGGINVNYFSSGDFSGGFPPPPASFTTFFPGESASISATPGRHLGLCAGGPFVFNVLDSSGGPISDQIIVTTGCPATTISFVSDGPGSPPFSLDVPVSEVVEDGTDQFVGSYTSGDGTTVNLFVQSDVERIPVPATLALLVLGLVGIGFSRRKAV